LFYHYGVFSEYDYWAGTVSLVIFALAEAIVFSWVFGIDKGWREIITGADIRVPGIYKYIIKYVTPVFLLSVFTGSVFSPKNGDWGAAFSSLLSGNGWDLDNGSLIKMVLNTGLREQIAGATDALVITTLEDQLFYINASRALLTAVFLGLCLMVYMAGRNRRGKETAS
jgi:hypothetical protein